MSDNKYYTPDIEDIRIGYECEIQNIIEDTLHWINRQYIEYDENWKKLIIDGTYNILYYIKLLENGHLRTSFLTKEQIIKEGWEFIDQDVGENFIKFKHPKDVDLHLTYDLKYHYLRITIPAEIMPEKIKYRASKYFGYCFYIHQFRYLCKLLKIGKYVK